MFLKKIFYFSLFSSSPPVACIEPDGDVMRIAVMKKKNKKLKVIQLQEYPLDGAKTLLAKIPKGIFFTTLIEQKKVLIRNIDLENLSKEDAVQAAPFELEPKLPFKIEDAIIDTRITKKTKKSISLQCFIAKKSSVENFCKKLHTHKIPSDNITCPAAAIAKLLSFDSDKEKIAIYIGAKETTVLLTQKGIILSQFPLTTGDKDFSATIQRTLLSFVQKYPNALFSHITLLGRTSPEYAQIISEATQKKIQTLQIPIGNITENETRNYACVLGGCLEALDTPINLKKGPFSPKIPFKRILRPAYLNLFLASILSLVILISGFQLDKRMTQSHTESLDQFHSFLNQKPQDLPLNAQLIHQEYQQLILNAKKSPTYQSIPRCSKIFQFLEKQISEASLPLKNAKIDSFQWHMDRYPSALTPYESYEIKCELTLQIDADNAEQSLLSLLKKSFFVDQSKKISIKKSQQQWSAIFFIKTGEKK